MKAIAQKLLIGLLAIAVTTLVASLAQAQPPHPWPHPGPHPGPFPGPHPWHPVPYIHPWAPPVVIYHPRPYIVERVCTPYCEDVSNPAPAADIRLVNPAENRVTLKYTLNGGDVQSIEAGSSVQINQPAVIAYDRGANLGRTRLSLTDGTYTFKPTNGGYWRLFRETEISNANPVVGDLATNPLPGSN